MKKENQSTGIKSWPKEDRPREKLLRNGEHTLSDSELLAILLRTGVKGSSAIDLARKIISKFKTFRNMSHTDIREWKEFKGLGQAKLAQIKAALEIARRFNSQQLPAKKKLVTTEQVVKEFEARMRSLKNEVFKVLFCDAQNRIIEVADIAQGTPTESYPIIREIISKALQHFSTGIICLHNHPLGDPVPSKSDEIFTDELKKAAKLTGIKLLDHIIFAENGFYSFDKMTNRSY